MNSLRQELQHILYDKVKYEIVNHQACYNEQQTKEIIEYLESLKIMKKLTQ